jgi:alpha-tubulin suppressor-like RCC1 family protein
MGMLSQSKHVCLLPTASGDVYSWGSGSEGQLGLGTRESHSCPVLVEAVTEAVTKVGR